MPVSSKVNNTRPEVYRRLTDNRHSCSGDETRAMRLRAISNNGEEQKRSNTAAFTQLDRALIAKRLRDGRRAKAAKGGKASGSYPYGWSKDGEVPAEQKVLVRLLDCAERGLTLRATAADLNGRGFRTRHGRTWTIGTVSNVLRYARRKTGTPVG